MTLKNDQKIFGVDIKADIPDATKEWLMPLKGLKDAALRLRLRELFRENLSARLLTQSEIFSSVYGDLIGKKYWLGWHRSHPLPICEIADLFAIHHVLDLIECECRQNMRMFDEIASGQVVKSHEMCSKVVDESPLAGFAQKHGCLHCSVGSMEQVNYIITATYNRTRVEDLLLNMVTAIACHVLPDWGHEHGQPKTATSQLAKVSDVLRWLQDNPDCNYLIPLHFNDALGFVDGYSSRVGGNLDTNRESIINSNSGRNLNSAKHRKYELAYRRAVSEIIDTIKSRTREGKMWHQVACVRDWLKANPDSKLRPQPLQDKVNAELTASGIKPKTTPIGRRE